MKLKAVMCTMFALLIIISSACSNNTKQNSSNNTGNEDESGPVEVSMIATSVDNQDTWAEQQLEEIITKKTGREFNLNSIILPSTDPNTKLNLLMTEKDTMPAILNFSSMEDEYQTWAKAGVLQDLTPYLQEHGKSILNYFSKEAMFYYWDEGGALYRFQNGQAEPGMKTTMLRKDWLDNLDLEIPETLDEYIEVLRAFTHDDPDGNGKDDTYGFAGQNFWDALYPFLGAYGLQVEALLEQEDGTVKFSDTMPEMKEVLKILQDLYTDGVIDPRLPTNDSFTLTDEIYAKGKAGSMYQYVAYLNPSASATQSFKQQNPDGEYIAIDPVKGPDGFASDYPTPVIPETFVAFTQQNQYPEISMQLLNELNTPETFQLIAFGVEGEDYELTDDGMESKLNPNEKGDRGLSSHWPMNRRDEANIENLPEVSELFAEREKTSQPMRDKIVELKASDRPEWEKHRTDLEKLRDQTFWNIIIGKKDVNAFDDFVEKFYASGGQAAEDEANALFKEQEKQREKFDQWYEENIEPYK
ncbi:extracellular solute-binding protein [Bacillus sp. SD088]|uniref:extracellular solute-binding protein n=1 Tax=Bacillus sp. SD088 TaxID=2782012 RepID=UPI001A95A698|nr:extracellular solute-binding protein [Bacillus sp. SD088]MBO0995795.1 extracellular solute-binding protein [Bacillus sp. SD088]